MRYVIVDRNAPLEPDGVWGGQGLFRAMGDVYLMTETGEIYDMDGVRVSLPNDAVIYPMQVATDDGRGGVR